MIASLILLTAYQQAEITHLRHILLNDLAKVLPRGEIFHGVFSKEASEVLQVGDEFEFFSQRDSLRASADSQGVISLVTVSGIEHLYKQAHSYKPFGREELDSHAKMLGAKPLFLSHSVEVNISEGEEERYWLSGNFIGPMGIKCARRCIDFSIDQQFGFPFNGFIRYYNPDYPPVPEGLNPGMPPLRLEDFSQFDALQGEIFNSYKWFDVARNKFKSFDEARNTPIPQMLQQEVTLVSNKMTSKSLIFQTIKKETDGKTKDVGKVVNLDGAKQNTDAIQRKMVAIDKVKSWQYVGAEDHRQGTLKPASDQTAQSAESHSTRSEAVLINDRGYFYKVQTSANRDVVKISGQWFIFVEKKE